MRVVRLLRARASLKRDSGVFLLLLGELSKSPAREKGGGKERAIADDFFIGASCSRRGILAEIRFGGESTWAAA
jgi:hypothetical protein